MLPDESAINAEGESGGRSDYNRKAQLLLFLSF